MALNQIAVSKTTPWGQMIMQYRDALISYRQQQEILKFQGAAVLGKIAAMVDGTDYTRLEQQLTLQTGQGATLFAQLNSVVGNFKDNQSATLNAAVDQFDNWIG